MQNINYDIFRVENRPHSESLSMITTILIVTQFLAWTVVSPDHSKAQTAQMMSVSMSLIESFRNSGHGFLDSKRF